MEFKRAQDIQKLIDELLSGLPLAFIKPENIICFRSHGSKSRAIARIWGLPRIWQLALDIKAHYLIEVIAERFDRLTEGEKERVLIHELMHIPKTFSGALVPHICFGKKIDRKTVEKYYTIYSNNKIKRQ